MTYCEIFTIGYADCLVMSAIDQLPKLIFTYSEVPNRRADRNKQAGLEKIPP